MKVAINIPFVSCLLMFLLSCGAKKNKTFARFDAETFVPTYKLVIPENWTTERFAIPIEFAPSIPYAGIEELRFAPGWDNFASEDYWTYCYLWYLSGKVKFSAATLSENLEAYYTGLIDRNIEKRNIPQEKISSVKANFMSIKTQEGDVSTFKGSVNMLDYMAQRPITLNFLIHVKDCPGQENTFIFFEASPRETTHPIWGTLNGIWKDFECEVN